MLTLNDWQHATKVLFKTKLAVSIKNCRPNPRQNCRQNPRQPLQSLLFICLWQMYQIYVEFDELVTCYWSFNGRGQREN